MKRFKLLSAAVLLGCSTLSFAQTSADVEAWKGFRFSFDHAFLNSDVKEYEELYPDNGNGFSVGYEQAFRVAKKVPLFIQTGLGMNMLFGKAEWDDSEGYERLYGEEKYRMLSLSIPINLVYGIRVNDALTIKPFTGFYLRANLFGKDKWSETYEDETVEGEYELFNDSKDENDEKAMGDNAFKRVQFGWQIGATMDIRKFNIGIGYALDFNKLAPQFEDEDDNGNPIGEKSYKMGKLFVRVGFNF